MFNRKSSYALNKKDPDAIVYMDANEVIVRLTREDFASEKEFLKWKALSDEDYHTSEKEAHVYANHTLAWMSYPRKRPPFLPWMSAWSRRMTGQRQSTAASERSRRFGST